MKSIYYLFSVLLLIPLLIAGVSHPTPLTLASGETGKFNFAIDAALFSVPLECKIEFEPKTPLKVKFDKTEARIEAGKRIFIQGEVEVPKTIKSGSFKETFCVSCDKVSDTPGTTTRPRYCDIPIRVTISGEATPKPTYEMPTNLTWIIILSIINILLVIFIIFLITRKMKKTKATPKIKKNLYK